MFNLSLITCFSHTLSLHQIFLKKLFYIDNILSINLVTSSSNEYSNLFAHAYDIGWTLILMSNKSSTFALVTFAHGLNTIYTGILVINNISIHSYIPYTDILAVFMK